MKVTVSVGPGPHAEDLVGQLKRRGMLERVLHSWPAATAQRWVGEREELVHCDALPFHPSAVRATWAIWTRIPRAGRHRTPQPLIDSVYDRWASRRLGDPDLFVGWSQVSLHSLRAAKARRLPAVLEHPMMHVEAWDELAAEEQARHSPRAPLYSSRPRAMSRRMAREYTVADAIVVPSTAALRSFTERGVAQARIAVVPLGASTDELVPPSEPPRGGPFRLLYVGRLELLKGVHYLLEAWSRLRARDAELWLVGPVLPEVETFLARHGGPDVKVLGAVAREKVREYYRLAHALVFPSLCDGFGVVMLEAMACGLPVLATTNTGAPDVIAEGESGFVVPIRDPAALADRIDWMRTHRDDLPALGRVGRATVVARYTVDHYGDRLAQAYASIRDRVH